MRSYRLLATILPALALALCQPTPSRAADDDLPGDATPEAEAIQPQELPRDEPPGGETLAMARFYPGNLPQTGSFPGKLVCLPEAKVGLTAGAEKCGGSRYYALVMQGGAMVHPLIPGSKEVLDEFERPGKLGQDVEVHGKHYSSTGMILVDEIRKPRANDLETSD